MDFGIALLIVLGLVVLGVIWIIMKYNQLISLRNRIQNAWSQIDVQLRRRYDLIPNLIETVKGYAKHESEVFENVTKARTMGINATTVKEQGEAENIITGALKSLFAVTEAYPELKANENFMMLQEELSGTESKIAYSRQFYNDTVMVYNTLTQVFPTNIIAGSFGMEPLVLTHIILEPLSLFDLFLKPLEPFLGDLFLILAFRFFRPSQRTTREGFAAGIIRSFKHRSRTLEKFLCILHWNICFLTELDSVPGLC